MFIITTKTKRLFVFGNKNKEKLDEIRPLLDEINSLKLALIQTSEKLKLYTLLEYDEKILLPNPTFTAKTIKYDSSLSNFFTPEIVNRLSTEKGITAISI